MTYGVNAPLGLQATTYGASAPWTGGFPQYQITPLYGTNLFLGDLVTFANGLIVRAANGAGNCGGVFWGCTYTDPTGILQFSKYWPSGQAVFPGTVAMANIITDPQTVFTIQADGVVAQTAVDLNADVSFVTAGNTSTGESGMMLQTASIAVTSTLPLHILNFDPIPGNVPGISFPNLLVKLNMTTINAGATGV